MSCCCNTFRASNIIFGSIFNKRNPGTQVHHKKRTYTADVKSLGDSYVFTESRTVDTFTNEGTNRPEAPLQLTASGVADCEPELPFGLSAGASGVLPLAVRIRSATAQCVAWLQSCPLTWKHTKSAQEEYHRDLNNHTTMTIYRHQTRWVFLRSKLGTAWRITATAMVVSHTDWRWWWYYFSRSFRRVGIHPIEQSWAIQWFYNWM